MEISCQGKASTSQVSRALSISSSYTNSLCLVPGSHKGVPSGKSHLKIQTYFIVISISCWLSPYNVKFTSGQKLLRAEMGERGWFLIIAFLWEQIKASHERTFKEMWIWGQKKTDKEWDSVTKITIRTFTLRDGSGQSWGDRGETSSRNKLHYFSAS